MKYSSFLLCAISAALTVSVSSAAPTSADPVSVLFLSTAPAVDAAYGQRLRDGGIQFATASLYDPIDPAELRRFNTIVVDTLPGAGDQYDVFGHRMLRVWENLAAVWDALERGAGVLVYPNLADQGGSKAGGWNAEMQRWGIRIEQACVLDPPLAFETWRAYAENSYCWTENLIKHPLTDGLRRIYYASANLRWDDCYTTPPLLCGPEWTAIVRAGHGAQVGRDVDRVWVFEPKGNEDLVLAAVRPVGKGQLGVIAINPGYIHRFGYTRLDNRSQGEMSFGYVDGIILEEGNDTVASDTGTFVLRLYRWLGNGSAANGFGGYVEGETVALREIPPTEEERSFSPSLDFDNLRMPLSWRHRPFRIVHDGKHYFPELSDPLVTGELQFFKILVGAHTALSDGTGSVADFADAAQNAGYSIVVFTEAFEDLTEDEFGQLQSQCQEHSSESFVCLPGIDIADVVGNHYILVAPPYYPRRAWLSADGRRLEQVQMINLLYCNHMVVAHRPSTSPLPQERLKHFQGFSVFTYRDGELADSSLDAYGWQAMNGSNPHPIAVHEVSDPADVAECAQTGFQQLAPSDTVTDAAGYFRYGLAHYFEAPTRHLLSEGPVVHTWVIRPKDYGPESENRMQFRVDVGVRSDVPLRSVELMDGQEVVRRWLPATNDFTSSAHFRHSRQYGLYVIAEDAKGRRVVTSSIRTVPPRFHFRCSDRQNWLGHVGAYYTGAYLPHRFDLRMPVRGTAEASRLFTNVPGTSMAMKLNFPFSSPDVVLTEAVLDERYVRALFADVGMDAMPSRASKPSSVCEGVLRHYSFTPGKPRQPYLALVEYDIRLKRTVEPVRRDGLWPAFAGLRDDNYAWYDENGEWVTGTLDRKDAVDLPVGGMVGGFVALTSGLRAETGQFGLANPASADGTIPGGMRFTAKFLMTGGKGVEKKPANRFDDPRRWLDALGFGKELPYKIELTDGCLRTDVFPPSAGCRPHGLAGSVVTTAELPFDVPVEITGLRRNWPAGVWREGETPVFAGVFEERAWPRIDVSHAGRFYAGHLLTADNPALILDIITWTAGRIKVEVHNPTPDLIQARVITPSAVTDLRRMDRSVDVPAGSSIVVDER